MHLNYFAIETFLNKIIVNSFMGISDSIIETGVDKLVNIINQRGKLSSFDAAKELGVSNTVIMEWADFLEEEGIISVEYKFTKPFLISRKMTKKEVEEKAKEFSGKKEGFIRKAEVSLNFLENEASKLNSIKEEFDKIKKELGFDVTALGKELSELTKYEQLKIDLDKKIEEQKSDSMIKIEEIAKQFLMEKNKYGQLFKEVENEKKELEREKLEANSLEEAERFMKSKVENLKDIIKRIENKMQLEEQNLGISQKNIQRLNIMADSIRSGIEKEKLILEPLLQNSLEQEKKIREMQSKIVEKITDKQKKLRGVKIVSKRMEGVFKKKAAVINLIERVNKDRNELQNELIELIKKAKSFQISSKNTDIGKQMAEMENKFNEVESRKKSFEKELTELNTYFK